MSLRGVAAVHLSSSSRPVSPGRHTGSFQGSMLQGAAFSMQRERGNVESLEYIDFGDYFRHSRFQLFRVGYLFAADNYQYGEQNVFSRIHLKNTMSL